MPTVRGASGLYAKFTRWRTVRPVSPRNCAMDTLISLVECEGGAWSICRDSVVLYGQLRLGPAIRLARQLARDEHGRTGRDVSVVLTGLQDGIRLARYGTEHAAA